jgi:Hypothetical protein (DUF2513)
LTPAQVLEDNVSPLLPALESEMKRDMDVLRQILLEVESWNDLGPKTVTIDGIDDMRLNRGVEMLYDEKYLEGIASSPYQSQYKRIAVRDLSMKGHDFLDSIRDPDVWNRTKQGALDAGGFTMDILADLAKGFIKKRLRNIPASSSKPSAISILAWQRWTRSLLQAPPRSLSLPCRFRFGLRFIGEHNSNHRVQYLRRLWFLH